MSVLNKPYFHDEAAAFAKLEEILWADGPVCPHCGGVGRVYDLKGPSLRMGLKKCGQCRKQFTVKVGTVFESSHIPLHKWLQAVFLMAASKKGISAHQLHRTLEITYKSAWFMAHRIREAMRAMGMDPMGGEGMIVEADETYHGKKAGEPLKRTKHGKPGHSGKRAVLALVERGGSVRSFYVGTATAVLVRDALVRNVSRQSVLMTDESRLYRGVGKEFAGHKRSHHASGKYVKPGGIHTNTIEGYFSIFKRGMKGVYQHCSEKHLHRYLAEFDFRYNARAALGIGDQERAERLIQGAASRRLTYRRPVVSDR